MHMCWRQYNLYRVLDTGPTCEMWVVACGGDKHRWMRRWGHGDWTEYHSSMWRTGFPQMSQSTYTLYKTYPTGPMIFLTWIGRIIQCLPWICVLIVSCCPESGPMFCSVEVECAGSCSGVGYNAADCRAAARPINWAITTIIGPR